MTSGLIDWNQEAGTSKPLTMRSVFLSANKAIVPPACSKPVQNAITNTITMMMLSTRPHSARFRGAVSASLASGLTIHQIEPPSSATAPSTCTAVGRPP